MKKTRFNWDLLGMSASIACAIHCAVLPLFLTALPLFGWEVLHNPWFEGGMIGLAGVVGSQALYHGYKQHHRRLMPVVLFAAGFACLILKEVFHDYHVLLLVPAVGLILWAHLLNLRLVGRRHTSEPASADGAERPKAA
ncbi:MAG TPA: MerC domain-containing protein [Dinghuibacter sp.]|uniref:MerC domain-containing protein n=1 Tax=Dinghuibacter sp. TaxID=2024697 RepID=UPI002BBCFACF|nr:MerC domain-containing protein [Dinghuibacter sp.]HTJ12812.1 MerC domain-containing protein [Dinghuibacter sp.]